MMASSSRNQQSVLSDSATSISPAKRGTFIVLEGLDRSGKTTQVGLLEKHLRSIGKAVQVMRFPDRTTPIGQMIDAYLKSSVEMDDHVIHLLFSSNRWEAAEKIRGLLSTGTTVVCDRYYHSGLIYSAAKLNPTLSLHWARAPDVGLPRPDAVLFLDLPEEEARRRGGWGEELYERAELQRRVRELFRVLSLGQIETGLPISNVDVGEWMQDGEDLVMIDASPAVDIVAAAIWQVVKPKVQAFENFDNPLRFIS